MGRLRDYSHIQKGRREDMPDGPFFKSKMERNWSRYLDWLKSLKNDPVVHWSYEPFTFYFEGIRRGTTNYTPDFFVWETSAIHYGPNALLPPEREHITKPIRCVLEVHELAGHVTDKHRTRIKRMEKYYPWLTIKLIDQKAYIAVERKARDLVSGWEN